MFLNALASEFLLAFVPLAVFEAESDAPQLPHG